MWVQNSKTAQLEKDKILKGNCLRAALIILEINSKDAKHAIKRVLKKHADKILLKTPDKAATALKLKAPSRPQRAPQLHLQKSTHLINPQTKVATSFKRVQSTKQISINLPESSHDL